MSSSSSPSWAADLMGGYSEAELSAAFNKVASPINWKYPVDALLPADTSAAELAAVEFAVVFYAGCVPTVTWTPFGFNVKAVGYYAAVGA